MLRWTAIISLLFMVTGTLCTLYPQARLMLFTVTTVITMALSTATSWWIARSASRGT